MFLFTNTESVTMTFSREEVLGKFKTQIGRDGHRQEYMTGGRNNRAVKDQKMWVKFKQAQNRKLRPK